MKNMKGGLKNYVIFPRQIGSDFRNGLISKPELLIYYWLRQNGDPYGIVRMGLPELQEFYPAKVSENWVNKVLLSLKAKRYIYYERRAGRRGSFEVHMGDFILPSGQIRTLDKFFNPVSVRSVESPPMIAESEPASETETPNQSFEEFKKNMSQRWNPKIRDN